MAVRTGAKVPLYEKRMPQTRLVAGVALFLFLLLLLLPLLSLAGGGGARKRAEEGGNGALPPKQAADSGAAQRDGARTIRVQMENGEILNLSLGEYLFRVVAAEMPASFEPEALKAQAVAARTYTISKLGRETKNHPDADMCTRIACCQAYITPEEAAGNWGAAAEGYTEKIRDAVAATDGKIILYDGKPIEAVFHSSAPGRTADAEEVWGSATPYLKSVDSPEGDEVPNYRHQVLIPYGEFQEVFKASYPAAKFSGGAQDWFQKEKRTPSGMVESIEIGGVLLKGTQVRSLFSLRSADFEVSVEKDGVRFDVVGYGHGVGMSQYGANALAKAGKSYEEILKWYYTGVAIQ